MYWLVSLINYAIYLWHKGLCMSTINLSLMVKYQKILSAEVCFWWINNRLLSFNCKINTNSPSYLWYFNCSIMMNFSKTSSSCLIEISAQRVHTILWMILRKRPSRYICTDLRKACTYIQEQILLQCSIYYFKCKQDNDPFALSLTFSCFNDADNVGYTNLMYFYHNTLILRTYTIPLLHW